MDNCWDYNNGNSEIGMGKALRESDRQKVFLMTKIDGRTKQEAARQMDESLKRLQTDHIDLLQPHEVIRPEDPDRIFGEGGAQEAILEARKVGKIFIRSPYTSTEQPRIHSGSANKLNGSCFHIADGHVFETRSLTARSACCPGPKITGFGRPPY
jgi:Aldo/keto reductase family